jgi:hypothetical protein
VSDRTEAKQIGLPSKPEWAAIEAAARAEAMALVEAERQTPLAPGSFVAWALRRDYSGVTSGFSPLHRVGAPIGDKPHTTCHERIPDALLRLPLTSVLIRTFEERCQFCAQNTIKLEPVNAA